MSAKVSATRQPNNKTLKGQWIRYSSVGIGYRIRGTLIVVLIHFALFVFFSNDMILNEDNNERCQLLARCVPLCRERSRPLSFLVVDRSRFLFSSVVVVIVAHCLLTLPFHCPWTSTSQFVGGII